MRQLKYIEFTGPSCALLNYAKLPPIGPAQALIETTLSGVSAGTERMWFTGTAAALRSGRRGYPYRPGYALVGRVVEIADGFRGLQPGDRVFAMKPHASHVIVDEGDPWFRLPAHLSDEDAVAVSLTATAIHAIHRAGITIGDAVAVAGLGMLGLIYIQLLAATIRGPILALTRTPDKIALATAVGASRACLYETVRDSLTGLPPLHCAFECSGAPDNLGRLMTAVASQGRIVLAGFYNDPVPIDGELLFAKELTILGVRATGSTFQNNEYNRWDRRRNLEFAFAQVEAGNVRIRDLVTHRFKAAQFADAYELIRSGAPYLQVCIDWT